MPSSTVLAEMLIGNLKMVVSSIFCEFTPIFSLIFMHKIIANYGDLTEIQHEECANTQCVTDPSKSTDFGKKKVFAP